MDDLLIQTARLRETLRRPKPDNGRTWYRTPWIIIGVRLTSEKGSASAIMSVMSDQKTYNPEGVKAQ